MNALLAAHPPPSAGPPGMAPAPVLPGLEGVTPAPPAPPVPGLTPPAAMPPVPGLGAASPSLLGAQMVLSEAASFTLPERRVIDEARAVYNSSEFKRILEAKQENIPV